jgi:FkbM family methyltransferase
MPAVQHLRSRRQIEAGVGQGLWFDPGASNAAYTTGTNELPLQQALSDCLRPGDVFYDVGANVGFFSVIAARLVGPAGKVYSFEPVPENAAFVLRNAHLNQMSHIDLRQVAIASQCGQGGLTLAAYSGGAALTSVTRPPDATETIAVETTTIDYLVFSENLRAPATVKIDVEGAEMEVLRGMTRTMSEVRPVIVYEIDDALESGFRKKYEVCAAFLEQRGYDVQRLPDSYPNTNWIVGHAIARPR